MIAIVYRRSIANVSLKGAAISRYKVMSIFSSLAVSIINYGPKLLFVTGLIEL